jgi:hypothetical protein
MEFVSQTIQFAVNPTGFAEMHNAIYGIAILHLVGATREQFLEWVFVVDKIRLIAVYFRFGTGSASGNR